MRLFTTDELDNYSDKITTNCNKCGLDQRCTSPKMGAHGKGKRRTLILGDYPGELDDEANQPFLGKANIDFLEYLRGRNFDPFDDFWFANVLNCRKCNKKGDTVEPTKTDIKRCQPFVENMISQLNPKNIIVLGDWAAKSIFNFIDKSGMEMMRGMCIPDQVHKANIWTTVSPRIIDIQNFNKNLISVYERDLETIFNNINRTFIEYPEPKVNILYNYQDIIDVLRHILEAQSPCYIDYETTGLKPHYNGHKIVSASICVSQIPATHETYSFPIDYRNYFTTAERREIKHWWRRILLDPNIPLSAHNMKFEDSWSKVILKAFPRKWEFDTQIAAHILDNRSGITGLKNQVYLRFGQRPYNKHIDPFLEEVEGTPFNRVEEIPLKDLLKYGGLDSAYGTMLETAQRRDLTDRRLWGPYRFFHRGTLLMSRLHDRGIAVDEEYYHRIDKELDEQIENVNTKIYSSNEAKLFFAKTNKTIDIASSTDMKVLVYDILGTDKTYTAKNNLALDKTKLEKLDIPFIKDVLQLRKLEKAKTTYIGQFLREIFNGRINPFFDLNTTVSYRSSSSKPNFQNIPTREPKIKKYVRSGFFANPGCNLLFFDGSGMEVRTSVCYHKDPNMIKYVMDPTTDMHRDTAADIWMLPPDEITKDIRFYAKNGWVFAQFYGSYWLDCGTTEWETCITSLNLATKSGLPLIQHLLDKGIHNINEFLEHCKEVERIFWKERFKVYHQWKWDINEDYKRDGFITSLMGFVYSGIMNRKQVSNYPIQGTAFHLLLWVLIELEKIAIKEKWKSKISGQIHDEGIVNTIPEERDHIIATTKELVGVRMPKVFPWINVPFEMEFAITPDNGSWYDKQELVNA